MSLLRSTCFFRFLALALLLTSGGSLNAVSRDEQFRTSNGILAVVEDRVITHADVRQRMDLLVPNIRAMSANEEEFRQRVQALQHEVVQSLVDRILVIKEFENKGFQLPESIIDNEIQIILVNEFDGDRSAFLRHLQERGITTRTFRREVRENLILRIMRGQMRQSQAVVSPVRMEEFYRKNPHLFTEEEAVLLRIIELSTITAEPLEVLRQTAEKILAELEEGTSFGDLARRYSQNAPSRASGGNLGWVKITDLREDWKEPIANLQPGETSAPIQSGRSLFILLVEDRREGGVQPISRVRDRIEEELVNRMAREAQERWLERLRQKYYVRFF